MINRYLGNKTSLLDPIMAIISNHSAPGSRVCDIFSGTLSVSLRLKRQGYSVIANDINLFSSFIGQAFLVNNLVPSIDIAGLIPEKKMGKYVNLADAWIADLVSRKNLDFLKVKSNSSLYKKILITILYLQHLKKSDLPKKWSRSDFFDNYTEFGLKSQFKSLRGQKGRRRFFTGQNGGHIDTMLGQIRYWRANQLISPVVYATLICVILRAVEKVSNTQGTYHDFPREGYDSRALNPIILEPPSFVIADKNQSHTVGNAQDSLEFIKTAPSHDIIYVDPPYNFRQYTSYYFMLNLICKYSDMENPESYFSNIEFVRGQNMTDDFNSSFCKKGVFIEELHNLIQDANTNLVVLSYFDGRNHWNDFSTGANGVGFSKLESLFQSSLFKRDSLRVTPIPRLNYQSYGGHKAKQILEYLFVAEKAGT